MTSFPGQIARNAVFALGLVVFVSAVHGADTVEGFTCCNLHYDKDLISDINWGSLPFIPAGSPAKVISFDSNTTANPFGGQANVEINGKVYRIGNNYGRRQEPIDKYIAKIIVPEDRGPLIESLPEKIRSAVKGGKVVRGMSREQVIVSLGYPTTHHTPDLNAPVWHYWMLRREPYLVHFDEAGRVRAIVYPSP